MRVNINNCERSELPSLFNIYIIIYKYKKTFKNEQRNRDDTAKKRVNTSGVGESNNYYEDIYNNIMKALKCKPSA